MGFPNITVGPADLFHYKRNTNTIAAAAQLTSGDVTEATETPDTQLAGATRLQAATLYNLAVVHYGAYDKGGLACTIPPTNYAFTSGSGKNAILVTVTAPAYTLMSGLLINDALVAVSPTPLSVRNGSAGATQILAYYEPSAKALTRSTIITKMTGITVFGFNRENFAETTGDTTLNLQPQTVTIERNAGSDVTLQTGLNANISANLLATGKKDLADIITGFCTKSGGLKTKQLASIGYTSLGLPDARPVEIVSAGDSPGVEDSYLIPSALKISDQPITKNWSKTNPSQVPLTLVSADDELVKGVYATLLAFAN